MFSWDKELVNEKLNKVHKAVGYLMGRLSLIGFDDKMLAVVESISHDIIANSVFHYKIRLHPHVILTEL